MKFVDIPTSLVWHWWFVVDPLDDFKAILGCDYCDAGDTGDEVLQGNTTLQGLIAQMQWAEFSCIAVRKAKQKIPIIRFYSQCMTMVIMVCSI